MRDRTDVCVLDGRWMVGGWDVVGWLMDVLSDKTPRN